MPKRKLRNLLNLGTFSNYMKLPTYKKKKPQDKENVSNYNIGGMQTDGTAAITGNPQTGWNQSVYDARGKAKENLPIN
jgi:hypothetical protein